MYWVLMCYAWMVTSPSDLGRKSDDSFQLHSQMLGIRYQLLCRLLLYRPLKQSWLRQISLYSGCQHPTFPDCQTRSRCHHRFYRAAHHYIQWFIIIITHQYRNLGFNAVYRHHDPYRLAVLCDGCGDRKYKSKTLKQILAFIKCFKLTIVELL